MVKLTSVLFFLYLQSYEAVLEISWMNYKECQKEGSLRISVRLEEG